MEYPFDGNDDIIETSRRNDMLRRRASSSKANESTCRTIDFTVPMVLSFEHTQAAGAIGSEKKIAQ